jgi:RNA polymerase sigma factor (sigma-70 family)
MTRKEFSHYVATNYEKLYRFVKSRIGNAHDAEDVLQRVLLKLFRVCDDIDARAPAGFFFTALRTGIIDHWRKRGRRAPEGPLPDQVIDIRPFAPAPLDTDLSDRCRSLIRDALAVLLPRERRAFFAYWKALGDRSTALEELGLAEAQKDERYRVYDGALHHAKRRLALALLPDRDVLFEVGAHRIWEMVNDELWGGPGAAQ